MVAYVDGQGPPPPELEQALECQRWHSLPEAGGLLDQPAGMMRKLRMALNAFELLSEHMSVPAERLGDWIKANGKRYRAVREMRDKYGG